MEALGDLLAPYSESLGKLAAAIATLQMLGGVFLLNDIRKQGRSDGFPPEPFLGGVVLSILFLKMGWLMNDPATVNSNILGVGINSVFLAAFYWYASNEFKTKIWSKIGISGAFTVACLAYATYEDPKKIEFRFGMLMTGILVYLIGAPLLHLNKIIEKKSTAGMPFPIILSGTMVTAAWMLYGASIRNLPMAYQNLFLLVLSSIQLSMFAIYPNTPAITESPVTHSPSTLEHKVSKVKTPNPSSSNFGAKKIN